MSSRRDDILLASLSLVGLVVAARFVEYTYDDAFITYRYARNIVEGHGFVYNFEHDFLGTTTPLYTLILAGLGLVLDIPFASGLLSITSLLGGVWLIEGIGRRFGLRFAGSAAALFLLFEPRTYGMFGGETLFAQLLLLPLGLWLDLRGRPQLAAFVFGLAILTRMDSGLFVALVYATWIVRDRALPWQRVAVVALTLLPWFAFSWWSFGSPFPSTLGAKVAMGESGFPLYFEGSGRDLGALAPYKGATRWLFGALAAIGLLRILTRERIWLLFLANSVLFALSYQLLLGAAYSHWYFANALLSHALLLGAGVRAIGEAATVAAERLWRERDSSGPRERLVFALPRLAAAVLAVLIVGAAGIEAARVLWGMNPVPARRAIYVEVGDWLRQSTPETATVTTFEIGFLGYEARRTIIDPMGLVTPGGRDAIAKGDFAWVFDRYQPDYVVDNPMHRAVSVGNEPWFKTRYRLVHRTSRPGYRGELRIYERSGRGGGSSE